MKFSRVAIVTTTFECSSGGLRGVPDNLKAVWGGLRCILEGPSGLLEVSGTFQGISLGFRKVPWSLWSALYYWNAPGILVIHLICPWTPLNSRTLENPRNPLECLLKWPLKCSLKRPAQSYWKALQITVIHLKCSWNPLEGFWNSLKRIWKLFEAHLKCLAAPLNTS